MPQMEMLRLWLKDKIAVIVCNINFHMNSLSLAWQAALEAWRHPRNPLSWIRRAGWRDNARSSAQSDALCLAVGLYKMMIWYADCLVVFYPLKARKVIGNLATHWWIWWLLQSRAYDIYEIYESLIRESFTFLLTITICEKAHTFVLFWLFDLVMYSEAGVTPENLWKSAAQHTCVATSILRRRASGVQSNAEAVWLRWDKCCHGQGPLWFDTELLRFGLFGEWESETWSLWCVFLKKMQYCQALSCCRQLCRSHWCCSCCGAGKYLHGCECVCQFEVGMQQNSHEILLFGQVGESDRAAAEFADDNVTWSHLVTIKNSGRNRMKQTDSLRMDCLRSATNLALKWADKRLTFLNLDGWIASGRCCTKAQSSEWIPGDLDPTFAKLRRWWSVCSVWLDSMLLTTRLLMQIIYIYVSKCCHKRFWRINWRHRNDSDFHHDRWGR